MIVGNRIRLDIDVKHTLADGKKVMIWPNGFTIKCTTENKTRLEANSHTVL